MKLISCLLLMSFLLACKKDLRFTITATATDGAQKVALDGARVTLKQVNADGSEDYGYLADIIVPSSGKFEIEFKREKALKYILTIQKENYFTYVEEINFSDFDSKVPLIKNFLVYPKSWIKFHLKNNFPANSSDVFTLIFLNPEKNCEECCEKDKYYFNGAIDSTFYCLFRGGINYNFNYIVSSPFTQADFSVTTIPFDTVEVYRSY